jgi:uncharacterized protein (TIGR00290 family)
MNTYSSTTHASCSGNNRSKNTVTFQSKIEHRKAVLCWSSGKDSAWALHVLRQAGEIEVVGLMTTLNAAYDRVAMHGVRRELLEAQARHVGLPLEIVAIPDGCTNEQYNAAMRDFVERTVERGIEHIAFGDLFLEDIRAYRESRLAGSGITPIFPLWGIPTDELARRMIDGGLKATIVCVDASQLDPRFAGRRFDAELLDELPEGVDRCGERGEFHTFVHDGPMFTSPLDVVVGETVDRGGFVFTDIRIGKGAAAEDR